jgi:hypothetical protein
MSMPHESRPDESWPAESWSGESWSAESNPESFPDDRATQAAVPPIDPTLTAPLAADPTFDVGYRPPTYVPPPYPTPDPALGYPSSPYPTSAYPLQGHPGQPPYPGSYAGQTPYPGAGQYSAGPNPYAAPQAFPGSSPYPAPGYPPYGYPMARPTNTLAILSLVFAFVFFPAGIVCGHIARRQIARTGEGGLGLSTAGLVLSYLQVAFWILIIGVGVAATTS